MGAEPRTAAGRALLAQDRAWYDTLPPGGHPIVHGIFQRLPDALLAIEAEAVAAYKDELAEKVRALPTRQAWYQIGLTKVEFQQLDVFDVLALLEAEPPQP